METRLIVAYGLMIGIMLVGGIAAGFYTRRRTARKRRLRGIKSYNGVVRN